jgi:hypothetical protein
MTAYVGIDGKARKIGAAYIGVDGVARKVVKAYVGVNGKAQLWWSAAKPFTVTITKATPSSVYSAGVYWDGGSISEVGTYQVPEGALMRAVVLYDKYNDNKPEIYHNGEHVATGYLVASYDQYYRAEYEFALTGNIECYCEIYGRGTPRFHINDV